MTVAFHSSERAPHGTADTSTRWRLYGAFAGLVLLVLVTGADALSRRDGYDMTRHWVSLLQHGERGWLATAAFALAGLLVLASVPAFRSVRSVRSAEGRAPRLVAAIPGLVAVSGMALVALAICPIDPSMEYPVRTEAYEVSTTGRVHSVAGGVLLASFAALCWCIGAATEARPAAASWVPGLARASAAAIVALFVACSTLVVLSDAGSWEAVRAGAFQRLALLVGGVWLGWYALELATGSRDVSPADRSLAAD